MIKTTVILFAAGLSIASGQVRRAPSAATPPVPLAAAQSTSAAEATDISGQWHFLFNTDGGDRESNADFKLNGDQVTGKWSDADVKGTFKDGDLDLAFPFNSEEAGMTATMKIKGKLKDAKLTGTWQFGDYGGTFTGSRAK